MRLILDDADLDSQVQRAVAKTDFGMANVGECLSIASQISASDLDSWYSAFSRFAAELRERADRAAAAAHQVTARGAYLRACEYYRNPRAARRAALLSSGTSRVGPKSPAECSSGRALPF